ncbi:hypothetical protein MTR62_15615 [Novosphingobium sp. 1949]|uniref:Uncharacterized protein n=1 Tax=Novosphingobium organovorum TaxID=2930092 RepID=A0ABT0BGB6_9SPHN|nr:hypothetical protein [Novosphingobium organovorum]MCJ2184107.1 hypothetical protein [Novosphingobium organovorum]
MDRRFATQANPVHDIEHAVLADHHAARPCNREQEATLPWISRLSKDVELVDFFQERNSLPGQGDEVLAAHFHAIGTDTP